MAPIPSSAHVKDYCSKCTFAGVHYVADDTKHWIERLLWAVLIILSWYGSALLISSAWVAFVKSPISFGVETTYIDWETKYPAVAICEQTNKKKIYSVSDEIWPADHLLDLEDALKDIAYYRGYSFVLLQVCFLSNQIDPLCPLSNYSYYASLVRSPCQQILANCSYNNKNFDCCEYFQPIETDIGKCYIINSIQTKSPKPYPMVNNRKQKRGILRFQVLLTSMVYTLGEDEVPSITTLLSSILEIILGKTYRREIAVRDIENDPLLVETTREQRACRFHHENEDGLYPHYSYSACNVRCRKQAQMKTCNCNDHFMPGATEAERCNISGMACLHKQLRHLTTLKPSWAQRPGLTCDCLPSCNETEITVIKDVVLQIVDPNPQISCFQYLLTSNNSISICSNKGTVTDLRLNIDFMTLNTANLLNLYLRERGKRKKITKSAYVEIVLAYLPTERFKRNVVRSRLDLVVSVGGTAGLFVGASLLSFVELIFFFTVRFISNVWMEKRKHNNNVHLIRN